MKANNKSNSGIKGYQTLDQQHIELRDKAKAAGKTLALTGLPSVSIDEKLEGYVKSIRGGYSGLLAQEQGKIPSNQNDVAEIEGKSSEQKTTRLQGRLSEVRQKLRRAQLELSEMDSENVINKKIWPLWVSATMIAGIESLFSYKAFSMVDFGNNAILLILLVLLTFAFVMLPKFLRWWYETYIPESKFKWLLSLLPVIVIGIGFYVLGVLRANYLSSEGAFTLDDSSGSATSLAVSPWFFVGLNTFFLLIGYFIAHQFPSEEQSNNQNALDKKEAAIAKLEQDIDRYEEELSSTPERDKNSLIRASNSNAGRKDTYIRINNFFKEAVGEFIEANLTYRTDGQRPRCFDVQISDLEDHFA